MECVILEAPDGGARLELLAYEQPAPMTVSGHEQPSGLGLRHLAFAVENLEAVVARLRAAGIAPVSDPVTVPFAVGGRRKRLVYFHDPDGVLLELAEYGEVPTMASVIKVPDMMCGSCAEKIRVAVAPLAGVRDVRCDVPGKTVTIEGDAARGELVAAIAAAGFKPEP
jgi:copper chaperone CopZ